MGSRMRVSSEMCWAAKPCAGDPLPGPVRELHEVRQALSACHPRRWPRPGGRIQSTQQEDSDTMLPYTSLPQP